MQLRKKEIGIRTAPCPQRRQAARWVMSVGAVMAAIGGSMGFIAAWKFNRVPHAMSASMALVIGPVAWNSALAVGGPTFESAVTAAACYVLTLRSLSADPPVALLKE